MNSLIKTKHRFWASAGASVEVKPVQLTPLSGQCDADLHDEDGEIDPAQLKDPIQRARYEARSILRSAREEAEVIRQNAYAEGFRAGVEQAAGQAKALIERLESDLEAAAADRNAIVDSIEPEVLKLCLEIVEKVIRHEVKTDARVVMRVIKSCLRRIKDSDEIYVRVSPQDVQEVRASREELLALTEGVRKINIVDDRRVSPGGCIIESDTGDLDARIETQLSKIKAKLTETLTNDRNQRFDNLGASGDECKQAEQRIKGSGSDEISESDQSA